MGLLHAEPTEKVAEKVLKDFSDIEGLKEVVEGILSLTDSWVYEKLVHLGNPIDSSVDKSYAVKNKEYTDLELLSTKYLSNFPLNIPFAPLITVKDFWVIYTFITDLYSIRIGHKIYQEDLYKAEKGEMATRITLMLEDFDSSQETPEPTVEFFKRLGKVKWGDKKAKKLFNSVREILFVQEFNNWKGTERVSTTFSVTEKAFLKLLSGCSAVVESRDKINTFDIIKAHKTYLKLINTDISKLM
ncbi:MAG: hypothetical protein HZC47_01300 [Methanobacterium sp.]|uniref:hypothetical protein n=1 Tax=Methanobacterium sp. TaxID=2164 RepID=UPI003D657111|nr:hypothetical protein [Methanobacterium sp.]